MDIFKTATLRQSTITLISTLINGFLGAAFYILLFRSLGPVNFGVISLSITSLTLISDVLDFGTNTGLVKHVAASIKSNEETALKYLKLSLKFKFFIWIIVLLMGIILAPTFASLLFKKQELVTPLRLAMIGVGGALLFSFTTSALQAFQKFSVWGIVNISTNLLRFIFVVIFLIGGNLNLYSGLLSYILMPFFGFSLALFFLPAKKILTVSNELSVAKTFFKYNFAVALFTVIAAFSARLDTFLSARLLSNFELGIYSAANQLVQVIPQLVGALGVVAAPKFASFQNNKQMITYLKKFQLLVLGLVGLGILAVPIIVYLIPIIYGPQAIQTITPFIYLFLAMLVFLFSVPVHSCIIFYFGKPEIFVWVSIGHLFIIFAFGYILISAYGAIGAAISVLIGMIFNFFAPLFWLIIKMRKENS